MNCYMDSVKENNFYIGKVWIQCENRSCLKWRLLLQNDVGNIDSNAPWYCYMNIDPQFNKCSVAEEYFPKESQFQKHGLKYIYSKFPLGSLVLAKMRTWPRWPGILSPDPIDGQYVKYDFNGDVESHHVEFLGNPHSRSWTAIKYIDPYPSSFKADVSRKKKAWYESALEEANKLLACSIQQRLDICYLSKKEEKTVCNLCLQPIKNSTIKNRIGLQVKIVKKMADVSRKKKAWYESALEEANKLLACSIQQRLDICYLSKKDTVNDKDAQRKTDKIDCRKMIKRCTKKCGKKTSCRNERKQRMLTYPCKIARSEDILSKESLVVTETKIILKDLDQILSQALVTSKPYLESSGNGEDNNEREKILNCCLEVSEERRPMEINTEEDCIIIDGKALVAGQCIESITEQFKEIDSLMADFQGSL
ncbi:zinc finger CW-type PWWP domain protein 2 [Ahaetulla prasina]|uniref:zinc finger CW-type PWWP domain protein 2 n=1 Tax=Ahaetulla prasina TaxID=499056 RepID=UPI00264888F6|nr:zinc finger CW-type PWWP domain protein 2 [Ahaetulla prasina]